MGARGGGAAGSWGRFRWNALAVAGGTAGAQVILVLASPLLTRLYTPEEFGLFASFTVLVAVLWPVATLSYEYALPVVAPERRARLLAAAAVFPVLAFSLLLALLALAAPALLSGHLPGRFGPILAWLPAAVLLFAAVQICGLWWARRGRLHLNGLGTASRAAAQVSFQIAAGLAGFGLRGLLAGVLAGFAADLAVRRRALFEAVLPGLRAAPPRALLAVLRAHARYPLFSLPARLLTTASRLLPTLLVAAFFGPAIAGWFALARRVVATPLQMLGTSLGQSYVGWAGSRPPQAVCRMFRKLFLLCLALGALFFLPAAWLAPLLFEILFGAQWGPAGGMVTILAPLYFASFVFSALRPSWNIIGRLDLDMILAALSLAVMIASFLLARGLGLDWKPSLWLFSASLTGVQIFALALLWITVERHARGAGAA